MYYCLLVHTSVHFTDPREPRWGPYFGRFRCEACSIKCLILQLPPLPVYQTFHRLWLHSSLHSVHMYTCRESMDRTKIFVRQRRHTTLKMKRLNFITLLPPCLLLQSLAVGCSTSFLTKENWKLGVLLSAANVNKLSVMAPGFLYVINVLTWEKYYRLITKICDWAKLLK